MGTDYKHSELTEKIIGAAYSVYNTLDFDSSRELGRPKTRCRFLISEHLWKSVAKCCRRNQQDQPQCLSASAGHELIHAYDVCRGPNKPSTCDECACTEIRIYKLSGECAKGGKNNEKGEKDVERCIKGGAIGSIIDVCGGYNKSASYVEKMWETCYNNNSPFE